MAKSFVFRMATEIFVFLRTFQEEGEKPFINLCRDVARNVSAIGVTTCKTMIWQNIKTILL